MMVTCHLLKVKVVHLPESSSEGEEEQCHKSTHTIQVVIDQLLKYVDNVSKNYCLICTIIYKAIRLVQ